MTGKARYSFRAATDSDAAAVEVCVHAAYRHYIERIGTPPGPMLDDYAEVIRQRQVTIAESGGKVAGVLVLDQTAEGFLLENVAVDPSHKGTGLGKTLYVEYDRRVEAGLARVYMRKNLP